MTNSREEFEAFLEREGYDTRSDGMLYSSAVTLARRAWQKRDADIAALRAERDLAPLCDEHRKPGGKRAVCLVCACRNLSAALSRISYLCGEPNEMGCGPYDLHCDESAVVEQVRALRAEVERLRKDAERSVGKTAARCREMAMWPQGIDDEQAYYGSMFAEFITKEFGAAIDAAMRQEPKA